MLYGLSADVVVVVHLVFIGFVVAGPLLARRCPSLGWLHGPSLVWAASSITMGLPCPLTALEKELRRMAGDGAYGGGFVDRYVEGVFYPESLTPVFQVLAVAVIVVGYAGLYRRRRAPSRISAVD